VATVNDIDNILLGLNALNERNNEQAGIPSSDEDRLVDKNVIKSQGSTFRHGLRRVVSTLTGNEKTRTYNTATVMAQAFFDFNKKKEKDNKPSTLVARSKDTVNSGDKWLDKIPNKASATKLGLLAIAIGAIIMLADYVWDAFQGVGTWAMKTIAKIPDLIKGFHTGLKTFFKGYSKFADDISKWFDDGLTAAKSGTKGLKGVAQGFKAMLFKTANLLGTRLLKVLKFLPFFGSLVSFVFSYNAFKEGRWFRGTLEFLSGVLNLVPGAGWIASAALDGAMLIYDLTENSMGQAGAASTATKAVKAGLKFLPVLLKTAGKISMKVLTVLKWLPVIGGFAGIALSYMRFKEGEWFAGSIELISAIADFFPGPGTAISWVLDGALLLWDILKSPKKEQGSDTVSKGQQTNSFWQTLKDTAANIGSKLVGIIRYIPVFGNLWSIGEGIASIVSGNYTTGMKQLMQGLFIFLPPGVQDAMWTGFDWVMSLFSTSDSDNEKALSAPQTTKSFGKRVGEFIQNKMKSLPWFIRKPLEWLGILQSDDSSTFSLPKSSMEWADRIANAFNSLGDAVVNSLKNFIPSVVNVFSEGISMIKSAAKNTADSYMNWAHEKSQLTEEDMKHTKWAGTSSSQLAQDSYIKATGLSDKSELPSTLLRDQFTELVKSEEFSGNFREYKQSILGESAAELDKINKQITTAMREYDKLAKAGKSSEVDSQLATVKALTYRKEQMIQAAAKIDQRDSSASAIMLQRTADQLASSIGESVKDTRPALHVKAPVIADTVEFIHETNALLATNNELLFDLVNTEKQALNEHKKNKPGVIVEPGGNRPLDGGAVQGSFSSNKPGSKGSYNRSPYSLGASTPHVSM